MTDTPSRSPARRGERSTLSLEHLADRLGDGAGNELFRRVDDAFRSGAAVVVTGVREARDNFATLTQGHARIVRAQRSSNLRRGEDPETMVLIGMRDLEAVVNANDRDFDWAKAFTPRHDLPCAAGIPLRPGVRGRNIAL